MIEKCLTIAPVRSPVNLFSESVTDLSDLMKVIASSNEIQEVAEVTSVDWPFGYGSLEHDALSPFFRPIMRMKIRQKLIDQCHAGFDAIETESNEPLRIAGIEVLIYDDTLSILIVNWQGLEKLSADFQTDDHDYHRQDAWFTERTHLVAEVLKNGLWQAIAQQLKNGSQRCWRNPEKFTIFNDYTAKEGQPLWVSRVLVSSLRSNEDEKLEKLYRWCGVRQGAVFENAGDICYVGSGNVLWLSVDPQQGFDDLLRALCFMQFYCSILSLYRDLLSNDLAMLSENADVKSKGMLKLVEQRLDHLDFVALEYAHSAFGTQGIRRQLIAHIAESWKTSEQFQMVKNWAQVLRARIGRQLEAERASQNRTIQGILGVIGGLSLLDIALTMKEMSRAGEQDNLPGMLDLFSLISTDGIIYAAITLALVVGLLIYRNY